MCYGSISHYATSPENCPCQFSPPFSRVISCCSNYDERNSHRFNCWCEDWTKPKISYGAASNYYYLPSPLMGPRSKRIYFCGEGLIPGYSGHVPALKYHGAARTFGNATRDTFSISFQRTAPCISLPDRIWEQ